MEIWFLLALIAAIIAGIGGFVLKIAAERGSDSTILTVQSSILSSLSLLVCVFVFSDFSDFYSTSTFLALLVGITFCMTIILKIKSLKFIDSAIFFPLYKVISPMFAIIFGVFFFNEFFTLPEWIGLIFSLLVPVLLISKAEKKRQKNLYLGIIVLIFASVMASASIALSKYGTDLSQNIWLYLFLCELFIGLSALAHLIQKEKTNLIQLYQKIGERGSLDLSIAMGVTGGVSGSLVVFSFSAGGPLGIVYTIVSLYILIPIVLSVIYYQEHWNARKLLAIILSILALFFLK